jgi:hypothetical protein
MGIRIEIVAGEHGESWPLSGNCLDTAYTLETRGLGPALRLLGLSSDTEMGEERSADRGQALAAIESLLEAAKSAPRPFQIRSRGNEAFGEPKEVTSLMFSGLLVDGVMYYVVCDGTHWGIQPMASPTPPPSTTIPLGFRGEKRTEPAEIPTSNYGAVKVEYRKARSDLAVVLTTIRKFAFATEADHLRITVG